MFDLIREWRNAKLEAQLTQQREVQLPDDDYRYPPPSAYEVQQLAANPDNQRQMCSYTGKKDHSWQT